MSVGEVAGYIASALVFLTFYMKTMMPLRIVGIMSNVVFVTYGFIEGLLPILILHLFLFPLNILRLRQFLRLTQQTRESAGGDLSFESLLPFMRPRRFKAGDVVFRLGDVSNEMFYIREGVIHFPELDTTVGKGDTFGEISLFSPEGTRTATAICKTDCELFQISEDRVLQLYNQSPRFGFYMVRVITSRLIGNYTKLSKAITAGERSAGSESMDNSMAGQTDKLLEKREIPDTERTRNWTKGWRFRSYVPVVSIVAFLGLLFLGWKATPYVRSVLVRDAAVTTWSNVATSPIDGTIAFTGLSLNETVGPDGIIARVQNDHVTRRELDEARIHATYTRLRVDELEVFLDEIKTLDEERGGAKAQYADTFRAELDTKIANLQQEIAIKGKPLRLLRKIADRKQRLVRKGASSESAFDEAALRIAELEVEIFKLRSDLKYARVRREAANNGIFLSSIGTDPDWALQSRMDLKLKKKEARLELRKAQAELGVAESAYSAAEEDFRRLSEGAIALPLGSTLWSRRVAAGATVRAGDPIAEWINCSVLLMDVPLADTEMPLVAIGMKANVILDGETTARKGEVLLTRGSASTLGRNDLVAVAKGRDEDMAQVVIDISHERATFENCPVGRAAFVDFPDIGLLDIVSAWLRL
jgi:CRP-like cAMP-binding protein/multidrug resistance efflux pump